MRSPLSVVPKLHRSKRMPPERVLLGCPRISPQWELGALRALMKPQFKDAILHKPSGQTITAESRRRVEAAAEVVHQRLGYRPTLHWPDQGDYLLLIEVRPNELPEAKGLALVLSAALPGLWIVFGRLFIRDVRFFRRERGFKLNLVPATNVHLSRPIRAALSGVL